VAAGDMARAIAPLETALETDTDGSLHYQLARAYRRPAGPSWRPRRSRSSGLRKSAEARAQDLKEEFRITPP
jgi:hypothetical protein